MSQEQPRRQQGQGDQDPIKYGDVFAGVSGELGEKAVKPEDAAMMQSAETAVLGKTQKGGPAATMQSAANLNVSAGLVQPGDVTDVAAREGVTVTGTAVPGANIITESVAGQVVGQYIQPTGGATQGGAVATGQQQGVTGGDGGGGGRQQGGGGGGARAITIGQALEATAKTIPAKPVDQCDAAAIQAAEIRATGSNVITPGGVAATAQSAAAYNETMMRDEDKIKLGDVLSSATTVLPADKPATRQDAEGVVGAEIRNRQDMSTTPGGVAASVTVAARMNERSQQQS